MWLTFYLKRGYRETEAWLKAMDKVCAVLELRRVSDHRTLAQVHQQLLRMRALDQMQRRLLGALGGAEEVIAVDSTGYATTQASAC